MSEKIRQWKVYLLLLTQMKEILLLSVIWLRLIKSRTSYFLRSNHPMLLKDPLGAMMNALIDKYSLLVSVFSLFSLSSNKLKMINRLLCFWVIPLFHFIPWILEHALLKSIKLYFIFSNISIGRWIMLSGIYLRFFYS